MKNGLFSSEEPIIIPGSPFWTIFKRFGRDEIIAMIINVIVTAIAAFFFNSTIILSLAGPVFEKIGFFPAHFKEAYDIYKTTPKRIRKPLKHYLSNAFKNSSKSLTEDIFVHDPVYVALMYLALTFYHAVPVWILASLSFIVSVFIVAGLELSITEFMFWNLKRKLKAKGFGYEKYLESHFLISSNESPKRLLTKLAEEFNLSEPKTLIYEDNYCETSLPHYSGRIPKLRMRSRTHETRKHWKPSVQIVYTRPLETSEKENEQFRFFPIIKEKLFFVLNQKMPDNLDEIENPRMNKYLKSIAKTIPHKKVRFERIFVRNSKLYASVDIVHDGRRHTAYLLEVKTFERPNIMIKAMRFIMHEFSVIQTTASKYDMDLE